MYCHVLFFKNNIIDWECLPCEIGIGIFNTKTIKQIKPFVRQQTKQTFILLHTTNHFTFAYVNFEEKTFVYIDPMKATKNECENKFQIFLKCVNNLEEKFWKLKILDHYVQKDSYNCGVLCIELIEAILLKKSLEKILNPDVYRTSIKNDLIKYGDSNIECIHCEGGQLKSIFKCYICNRGVDKDCFDYYNKILNIPHSLPFTCYLCQNMI